MWYAEFSSMIITAIVFGFFFGVAVLIANNAKRKREANLLRLAIEKGQQIPQFEMSKPSKTGTLKAALIFLAVGVGFVFMVILEDFFGFGEISIGLIPLLVGVALLISWSVEKNYQQNGKSVN